MNLRWIIYLPILISGLLLYANCKQDNNNCPDLPDERGIIEQELDFSTCFFDKQADTYIINDSVAYQSLIDTLDDLASCEPGDFPTIDFNEHTLLAQWASGGGCTVGFSRKVIDDATQNAYVFTVYLQECGNCEMLGFDYNWVLVPKIPVNYSVQFKQSAVQ